MAGIKSEIEKRSQDVGYEIDSRQYRQQLVLTRKLVMGLRPSK